MTKFPALPLVLGVCISLSAQETFNKQMENARIAWAKAMDEAAAKKAKPQEVLFSCGLIHHETLLVAANTFFWEADQAAELLVRLAPEMRERGFTGIALLQRATASTPKRDTRELGGVPFMVYMVRTLKPKKVN